MAHPKPPIIETAVAAWRDAFRAIGAMPVVAGITYALVLATSLANVAIVPNPYALLGSPWFPVVAIVFSGVVPAILLAPLAIAVHRFVLLGERTNRYALEPSSSRYLRFVGLAIIVNILWLIPNTILPLIPHIHYNPALFSGGHVILDVVLIIIVLRRAILFPAIAVDAPSATWSKAGLDTKGNSWRVALIFILTALPFVVIGGLIYWPRLNPQAQPSIGSLLLFSVAGSVVRVAALCAFAAAASHIYRALADVMTRPNS